MKLPGITVFFIVIVIIFPLDISAATFTDDMTTNINTAEAQYNGLKPYAGDVSKLSDPSSLSFVNNDSPLGYVVYRVNNAESVSVGIYTGYGTCVSQGSGGFTLGTGNMQAGWSRANNAIYSSLNGFWKLELNNNFLPVFSPVAALPDDIKGYGLNVYASTALNNPLYATVTKSLSEPPIYEEYTVPVPKSAQHIVVEINDVTSLPLSTGGLVPNRFFTLLSFVKISGDALVMGEPAKINDNTVFKAEKNGSEDKVFTGETPESEEPESEEPESELPEETVFKEAAELTKESPAPTEKFEGTITSSAKASSTKQAGSTTAKDVKQKKESSQESVSSSEEGESSRSDVIYEVRREKDDNLLTSGVKTFTIAVSCAIGYMLIFRKK